MASGYVYVLSNKAFPDLLKIGTTNRAPDRRSAELFTTGLPYPFQIEFAIWCFDPSRLERRLHVRFSQFRCNENREFFDVPLCDVIAECFKYSMRDFDVTITISESDYDDAGRSWL